MKLKIKAPAGAVKVSREEAERLKEIHAFFSSKEGSKALLFFRRYCRIGARTLPQEAAAHTFLCGQNDPYNRIVEDMRWGYLASNHAPQIKILDAVEEDVYAGIPDPQSFWSPNRE